MHYSLNVILILCLALVPFAGCSSAQKSIPKTTMENTGTNIACPSVAGDTAVEDEVFFTDDAEFVEPDEGYVFEPPEAVTKAFIWTVAVPAYLGLAMLQSMIESGYSHSWAVGD